jgi:Tfp pilus assembly protein PilF
MALLELKQNHLHEADTEAAAILHKAPENTDALLISGLVAWRQSRLADAQRIFSRGAALDDRRADFHAFLGRIAEAQRRPQDALEQYEKALTLEPGDADVADRAARLRDAK